MPYINQENMYKKNSMYKEILTRKLTKVGHLFNVLAYRDPKALGMKEMGKKVHQAWMACKVSAPLH
jgi:hypothetical protein